MNNLLAHCVICLLVQIGTFASVNGSIANNKWLADKKLAKELLTKATNEAMSTARVDTGLLASICAIQFEMGDLWNAHHTFKHLMNETDDGGGYTGPLSKLTQRLKSATQPEDFDSVIKFFRDEGLGVAPDRSSTEHFDSMVVSMIARAAAAKKYAIAERLLSDLSVQPSSAIGSSKREPAIEAALWINISLIKKDNNIDEALRIATLYKNAARALVCISIFELSKFDPDVEVRINELLKDVDTNAETKWVQSRLVVALNKKKDGTKAAEMLRRLNELETARTYLHSSVAKLLRSEGKNKEARAILEAGELNSETPPATPSFPMKTLSREFGELGDLDRAIKLSGSWSRHDAENRNGLQSYQQPLHRIAVNLAKKGRLEDATRVAMAIEDNYWRADTLHAIGSLFSYKKKKLWLEFSSLARAEAEKITTVRDKQIILTRIIARRATYLDLTFEQVIEEIKPLSTLDKSSILAGKMEYLIDDLPIEKVKQAIAIIEDGDTINLETTAYKLLKRGETDLARETILKIELQNDREPYLHSFFAEARKNWNLEEQLDFISKAHSSERPALLLTVFKSGDERVRAAVAPVALESLQASKSGLLFNMDLMNQLFDEFTKKKQLKMLGELMKIDLDESYQVQEMSKRIEKFTIAFIKESGRKEFIPISNTLTENWCQAAIAKALIETDLGLGKIESALDQVEKFPEPIKRAKLRILVAKHLIGSR